MQLHEGLGVQRGDIIAFIGAGGKSSTMHRLTVELLAQRWRVLVTTTTRISRHELDAYPHAVAQADITEPQQLSALLSEHGAVFLYQHVQGNKVIGPAPNDISSLVDRLDSDAILIEADGSRQRPLKAPHKHEPVIPAETTLTIPIAGFNAVGQPFDEQHVYNLERIQARYGFTHNQPIQAPWIAQVLRDETLGLQGIPERSRVVALLNQVGPSVIEQVKARRTAQLILQNPRVEAVALGRIRDAYPALWETQRRVGALVLAGGLSRRMGRSKPLLPWGSQTVIETIAQRLTPLRLADVVVVTGHQADEVAKVLEHSAVRTVYNPDYATGEMLSSVQTGLRAFADSVAACMIFLGDQPQLNPRLVNELLIRYAQGASSIVAPSYMRRRGHPILIDRRHWRELLKLPAGRAPRDVVNAYNDEIAYVLTDDPNIIYDMDTPEAYRAALKRAGLL